MSASASTQSDLTATRSVYIQKQDLIDVLADSVALRPDCVEQLYLHSAGQVFRKSYCQLLNSNQYMEIQYINED